MKEKNLLERAKEHHQRLINSDEFKKDTYANRLAALYLLPLMFLFMIPAYLAEKYLGISGAVTCGIAGVLAIYFAFTIAGRKAAEKFSKKDKNKKGGP